MFQGNNAKDESSETALFAERGSSPANIEAGTGLARGTGSMRIPKLLSKDQTWIRTPKNRCPKEWIGKRKDPVIRLVLAVYGHPDFGKDIARRA